MGIFDYNHHIVEGVDIHYHGNIPKKGIFVSFLSKIKSGNEKHLYSTALEIALNGYDGVYIPGSRSSSIFEKGIEDGGGRLFQVLPFSFEKASRKSMSKALVSGGGVFTIFQDSFSLDNLDKAKTIAALLSRAIIVAEDNERYRHPFNYIDAALSSGVELAVLKYALISPFARDLVIEGAPLIDSFSSFLSDPKYIAYERDVGFYGIEGVCFDIIKING